MLAAAALVQLSSVTAVAAAATHVTALAVLTVEATVLIRDGHSPPSTGLSVALYK